MQVRITALFADETDDTSSVSSGGLLGTFLRKLPNLERLDFDKRFRKRWAGAEDEVHNPTTKNLKPHP